MLIPISTAPSPKACDPQGAAGSLGSNKWLPTMASTRGGMQPMWTRVAAAQLSTTSKLPQGTKLNLPRAMRPLWARESPSRSRSSTSAQRTLSPFRSSSPKESQAGLLVLE